MNRKEKIESMMGSYGLTRKEAIEQLKDMGEY